MSRKYSSQSKPRRCLYTILHLSALKKQYSDSGYRCHLMILVDPQRPLVWVNLNQMQTIGEPLHRDPSCSLSPCKASARANEAVRSSQSALKATAQGSASRGVETLLNTEQLQFCGGNRLVCARDFGSLVHETA